MATIMDDDRHLARGTDSLLPLVRRVWDNLPLLLFIDIVLAASVLPVLAALSVPLLAPVLGALLCGPVWAAAIATADRLNRGDAVPVIAFPRMIVTCARIGWVVSLVPAAVATVLIGLVAAWSERFDAWWMWVLLLPVCSVAILVAVCCVSVYTLAVSRRLRGPKLWWAAMLVAAGNPMATVGVLCLLVLLGIVFARVAPMMLPVILAPFAVLCSATTWSTLGRLKPPGVDPRHGIHPPASTRS